MAEITPVTLDVVAGSTLPKASWPVTVPGGAQKNISSVNISATLYYLQDDDPDTTYWKVALTKSDSFTFLWTPNTTTTPFLPSSVGDGVRMFTGYIHYVDTGVPEEEWFEEALHVHVKPTPTEP